MSEKTPARRDFLKLALLGAASGAGLAAAGASGAQAATEKDDASAGYRETAHVRKYYELARF